jgi:glutamine synthetase
MIYPAAVQYQSLLATTAASLATAGIKSDTSVLEKVTGLVRTLEEKISALESISDHHEAESSVAEARHFCDKVLPAMSEVRTVADELEALIPDDFWPLPTYSEMLFIK